MRLTKPTATAALALAALLAAGCQRAGQTEMVAAPSEPPAQGTPKLVLWIVVDQMRADYLDRFSPYFEGGLKLLLESSLVFADAHHFHAATATAPGHSTLSTGSMPKHHGIVGNNWVDRATLREVYSAQHPTSGKGPGNLLRPTLGDRMKAQWPESKVFAIGGKDRSSILTAGHQADGALWYATATGRFQTSAHYADLQARIEGAASDDWLIRFFESNRLDPLFATAWEPLLSDDEMETLGLEPLDRGVFSTFFPRAIGGRAFYPGAGFYGSIYGTPFLDEHVVALAEAMIEGEQLGGDAYPDFLGVTLSALDSVGHSFGPNAPETADTILRLDHTLDRLFETVDRLVGLDQTVVVLSADHGVGPVPEMAARAGLDASRFGTEESLCFQIAGKQITGEFGLEGLDWMPEPLMVDRALLQKNGVEPSALLAAIAEQLRGCPRIANLWVADDLAAAGAKTPTEELFLNSYHPERSAHLFIELMPYTLSGSSVASHGSPHAYDTQVPLIFRLPSGESARIAERANTIDAAPSVAAMLGLSLEEFDGVDRIGQR